MKTLRKISDKKLDELRRRLHDRLIFCHYPPTRVKIIKKQYKAFNEVLRRMGLAPITDINNYTGDYT